MATRTSEKRVGIFVSAWISLPLLRNLSIKLYFNFNTPIHFDQNYLSVLLALGSLESFSNGLMPI